MAFRLKTWEEWAFSYSLPWRLIYDFLTTWRAVIESWIEELPRGSTFCCRTALREVLIIQLGWIKLAVTLGTDEILIKSVSLKNAAPFPAASLLSGVVHLILVICAPTLWAPVIRTVVCYIIELASFCALYLRGGRCTSRSLVAVWDLTSIRRCWLKPCLGLRAHVGIRATVRTWVFEACRRAVPLIRVWDCLA